MISSIKKNPVENLIPVLSKKEKQEMTAYYTVYEKYADEFSKKATEDLKDHPVLGKLIRDIPKDVSAANDKLSRELQKDAIVNNNWPPFIEHQIMQGIAYAKLGLDFKAWFEVIVLVRNYLNPYLHQEYGSGAEFLSALNGMNRFMDIAMGIIGEAYLQEKKEILWSNEAKLKQAQAIAHMGSWEIDFATGIGTWSEELCRIHGLLIEENKQSFESWLSFIHPEDLEYVKKEIEKSNASLSDNILNHRIIRKDGTVRNIYSISKFVLNHEGKPIGLYGISHDVTEQKIAEGEIKKLNDELEQKVIERTAQLQAVNNELEAFSYSISHDLRAPLRAINGFSKILHEDYASKIDADGMSSLNAIMNNSKKMGILIDDLLAFSRLGRKEISTSEINMTALVKSIRKEELTGNTNDIEFVIDTLLPAKGDQTLIKQVWVNLISNAVKYSKNKPKIKIEIGSYYKDNLVVYYVKDNGVGFDMQYYNKLFGVFQRLHSSEEFEGTGVGLAIVQKIIHRHNGTVWAKSKPNEETCFYFSLPAGHEDFTIIKS